MSEGSWYEGSGGWDTKFEKTSGGSNNIRFWMPRDSERKLVFLTGVPKFIIWEHAVKIGGNFRNYATCLKEIGKECPLCNMTKEQGVTRYQCAFFTVIDCEEWTDKDGNKHKNTKRLYVAKMGTWEKLERQARFREEKGQSLRGSCYLVSRGKDDKSPAVGDDFEFVGMVNMENMQKQGIELDEFDYAELLKPNEGLVAQLSGQVGGGSVGGRADGGAPMQSTGNFQPGAGASAIPNASDADSDIPF